MIKATGNMEEGLIEVGTTGEKAFVRVKGRGDFLNSPCLKDFINTMIEKGVMDFWVDLKECKTMDSTFMGVLAGSTLQLKNKFSKKLTLFNVQDHNLRLLTTLGIHIFLNIVSSETAAPGPLEALSIPSLSKPDLSQEMLKAHATLMNISEENRVKFKDVYEYLKEAVKRQS